MKTRLTLLLLTTAALAAAPNLTAQTEPPPPFVWRTQVVETISYPLSQFVSLAFNANGIPILAYEDGGGPRIKLATWSGSGWAFEVIATHYGSVSLAMDANDKPTVACAYTTLLFSSKPATKWSTTTVDRAGVGNRVPPTMAYDADGNPVVSYRLWNNGTEGVGFAKRTGSAWTTSIIDGRPAGQYYTYGFNSLAIDPTDGRPAIAYVDDINDDGGNDTVNLAKNTGTGWDIEIVDLNPEFTANPATIALAYSNGLPVIANCRFGAEHIVRILRKSADRSWTEQIIDSAGADCDLCIQNGKAWLAYRSGGKVKVATSTLPASALDPADWTIQVADDNVPGDGQLSLKLGPGGVPYLAYFVRGQLRLTHEDPTYPGPSFVFEDSMEAGVGGWTHEGNRNDSTPKNKPPGPSTGTDLWHPTTRRGTDAGHSPATSWYYGIDTQNNYITGSRNWGRLKSASINLPAGERAELKVSQLVLAEGGSNENGEIQISVNNGAWSAWTTIFQRSSRTNASFSTDTIDLSAYLGKTIRIGFFFDTKDGSANQYEGWYVDDVTVQWWP